MPIIRLLVAVEVRSGTPITRCITGTLMIPPPTPEQRRVDAREHRAEHARGQAVDGVARARQRGREAGRRDRPGPAAAGCVAPATGRRVVGRQRVESGGLRLLGGRARPARPARPRRGRGASRRRAIETATQSIRTANSPARTCSLIANAIEAADEGAGGREQLEGHARAAGSRRAAGGRPRPTRSR